MKFILSILALCITLSAGAFFYPAHALDMVGDPIFLNQNMEPGADPVAFDDWYRKSGGSQIIPFDWAMCLERHDADEFLFSASSMSRHGYLPFLETNETADPCLKAVHLPIGFVKDVDTAFSPVGGREFIGMTCAACHVHDIIHENKRYRVEGGGSHGDFRGMLYDLVDALEALVPGWDGAAPKFEEFADRLGVTTASEKAALQAEIRSELDRRRTPLFASAAAQGERNHGWGRLDAFGYIIAELSQHIHLINSSEYPFPKHQPAEGPVDYPHLWNIKDQEHYQWTGFLKSFEGKNSQIEELGALLRNTGQGMGVFGRLYLNETDFSGTPSSIKVDNLIRLEEVIETITPPQWPNKAFGTPDPDLVSEGAALFEANCASCHVRRNDDGTPHAKVDQMQKLYSSDPTGQALGTDPWAACGLNSFDLPYIDPDPFLPSRYTATWESSDVSTQMLASVLKKQNPLAAADARGPARFLKADRMMRAQRLVANGLPILHGLDGQGLPNRCTQGPVAMSIMQYKAGPITGIWATAPFLHNGSVANLRELLTEATERKGTFSLKASFSTEDVGYVVQDCKPDEEPWCVSTLNREGGSPVRGQSNGGHEYGTGLEPEEKDALIEYLKTL